MQVPGLDEDLPEAPPKDSDDSADLLPAEPDDPDPADATGAGAAEAECAVPGKALRQMVMVLVPAAGGVAAGLACAWTSRGTLAAERASVWALNLSRQVRHVAPGFPFAPPRAAAARAALRYVRFRRVCMGGVWVA